MSGFIVSYVILCLIYSAYWFARNRQESLYRLIVVLFLPVAGFLFFIFVGIFERFTGKAAQTIPCTDGAYDFVSSCRPPLRRQMHAEDLIPVEEALLLNNHGIRRRMILDILQDNMAGHAHLFKTALNSDDSEIVHYAAASVVELKRQMTRELQDWAIRHEKHKGCNYILFPYAKTLKKCLNSGLLDEFEIKRAKAVYSGVLNEILVCGASEDESFFIERIDLDIEAGNFDSADFYCRKFLDTYKQSEGPYLMYLKLFYSLHDRDSFNDILGMLERRSAGLSEHARDLVGFWTGSVR